MQTEAKQLLLDFIHQMIPNMQVSSESLRLIADKFEVHNLSRHEFLLKEGKISGYYYLAEGFLRAFTFDSEGNEITTGFYGSGRVVFEASSFFLHRPSTESIQAIHDCKGFYTNFEQLNGLFHNVPAFREFGRAVLVKEFVRYKEQTLAMINKSAEARYADFMESNREIFQYAQLKHIASFLGITDTSLSRIRRDFAKK